MNIKEAIILAGGKGTRLKSLVADIPKPLAPINNIPFLTILIRYLKTQGIQRVILSVGYKWELIKNEYGNKFEDIDIYYSIEETPLGTGGGIAKALKMANSKNVLILNGDSFCKIDIEDDGSLFIMAIDEQAAQKAKFLVESIVADVEVGKTYMGTVKRIMDFGAFVEIIPGVLGTQGKEGLVHISQLAEERVNKVRDIVDIGDKISVKVTEIDRQGRINLSRKAVLRDTVKSNP